MNVVSFDPNYKSSKHQVTYMNARYWNGRTTLRAQGFVSDDPEVIRVFEAAGAKRVDPKTDKFVEDVVYEEPKEEVRVEQEEQKVNWRELSWPEMRSLASQHSETPVMSKVQAEEVLSNVYGE